MTEQEIEICRAVGAKWVTYDQSDECVLLWDSKPVWREDICAFSADHVLAAVENALFPSLGGHACVEVPKDMTQGETITRLCRLRDEMKKTPEGRAALEEMIRRVKEETDNV